LNVRRRNACAAVFALAALPFAGSTFFLNGERLQGSMSFEEMEEWISPLLGKWRR